MESMVHPSGTSRLTGAKRKNVGSMVGWVFVAVGTYLPVSWLNIMQDNSCSGLAVAAFALPHQAMIRCHELCACYLLQVERAAKKQSREAAALGAPRPSGSLIGPVTRRGAKAPAAGAQPLQRRVTRAATRAAAAIAPSKAASAACAMKA